MPKMTAASINHRQPMFIRHGQVHVLALGKGYEIRNSRQRMFTSSRTDD